MAVQFLLKINSIETYPEQLHVTPETEITGYTSTALWPINSSRKWHHHLNTSLSSFERRSSGDHSEVWVFQDQLQTGAAAESMRRGTVTLKKSNVHIHSDLKVLDQEMRNITKSDMSQLSTSKQHVDLREQSNLIIVRHMHSLWGSAIISSLTHQTKFGTLCLGDHILFEEAMISLS